MDSQEYFERAEKSNKRFHNAITGLMACAIVVLIAAGALVYNLNNNNHDDSVKALNIIIQNQVHLNQNLSDEIHCILRLTPQTYNTESVNACFNSPNNITPSKP